LRVSTSLPAIGIATVIALAGLSVAPHPVAATDPSPTPAPEATADPGTTPEPAPAAEPAPTAEPIPAPTAAPPEPTPSATAEPAPSTAPTSAPTTEPVATSTPTTTAPTLTRAQRIRLKVRNAARIALRQRHDRYVSGATGPNAFDCSGLVRFAYRRAEISRLLGGGHSARAMLAWGRRHDRTSRRNPHVGDVVIWGNGRHAGIYLGKGRVISALNPRQDIRVTGLHALGDPFTAFIHAHP
jgi:cell wall-associated NlpC family hydrolase